MPRDLADELLQAKVKARLFGGDRTVRLGRLVILDRLGAGAMGTVYAAYDPRLDRRVAVKVLHAADADANARSLAEARVLAKLAHPNVIAIHDASEDDGCVHIVMELATGTPLRVWITNERTWREVVRVMRDAAAGLAAAHHAGVVHRDIKPDNIIVGEDAARVIDFGLAQLEATTERAGTPRYMAPEVLAGEAATAVSDQFSFGVTFREVLGDAKATPGWVHAIGKRMTAEPAKRFASMDEVVTALSRDRRRVRLVIGVAAAALVLGVIGGAIAFRGESAHSCDTDRVARAWNADRVRASLGNVPWTASAVAALDAHATQWDATYRVVCEATRVRGEQSDRLLELRMRCLDRALDRFAVLASALEGPLDGTTRTEAPGAIAQLPSPAACARLTDPAELALPTDPAERTRALAAERTLDRAWADYALGRYRHAHETVAELEALTADLDADGLRATLATLSAAIASRIGEPAVARRKLEHALAATAKARATELEHVVWTRLLRHELFAGDPARAVEWEQFARAAALRAGLEGAEIDGIIGEALRDAGDFVRAREYLRRALESKDPLRKDQRAIIEMNIGSVELAMGQPYLAEAAFQRALELARAQLGDGHPSLALYYDKLADADRARGRIASALAHHDRSVALRTTAYGEADRSVATARFHRAETLLEGGQLARAVADLEAARTIRTTLLGATSPRLGEIDAALGDVELARGRTKEALALYDRAASLDSRLGTRLDARRALTTESRAKPPAIRPFSVERAPLLARHAGALDPAPAITYAQEIRQAWQSARTEDPTLTLAAADALFSAGLREQSAELYRVAVRALADEPSRMRLHALRGQRDDKGAQAKADALAKQMPELSPPD
ncbi:MAG: serine/threonine-protein kinase [Myxococcota bacterium]|nr:serine/threonine-protein kinase [Myxococcota bacterium]